MLFRENICIAEKESARKSCNYNLHCKAADVIEECIVKEWHQQHILLGDFALAQQFTNPDSVLKVYFTNKEPPRHVPDFELDPQHIHTHAYLI